MLYPNFEDGGEVEIKYQIFEEENLLIQKFVGVFQVERYMQFVGYLMRLIHSNMINYVLIDFRDITFDIIPDDFEPIVDKLIQHRRNLLENTIKRDDVTIVFWVANPLSTAIAHLFKENFSNMNYHYCSTLDSVTNILKLPDRFKNIDGIMGKLENTF